MRCAMPLMLWKKPMGNSTMPDLHKSNADAKLISAMMSLRAARWADENNIHDAARQIQADPEAILHMLKNAYQSGMLDGWGLGPGSPKKGETDAAKTS